MKPAVKVDPEITAISDVYAALKDLDSEAQSRILNYVAGKLKLASPAIETTPSANERREGEPETRIAERAKEPKDEGDEELEGISPVAKKWMARNGLQSKQLGALFSLGVDEIDLVAKTVPGKSKKEKMRSVFLLKGVAAYLSTGAARFTHEQMKEACLHYDAFDAANYAVILKGLASEVSGSKDSGYTLTARGLANATEMIKTMTEGKAA